MDIGGIEDRAENLRLSPLFWFFKRPFFLVNVGNPRRLGKNLCVREEIVYRVLLYGAKFIELLEALVEQVDVARDDQIPARLACQPTSELPLGAPEITKAA
jgi:hypothetical protein